MSLSTDRPTAAVEHVIDETGYDFTAEAMADAALHAREHRAAEAEVSRLAAKLVTERSATAASLVVGFDLQEARRVARDARRRCEQSTANLHAHLSAAAAVSA